MLFRVRYNELGIRNGVDLEPGQLLLGLDEISEKAGISRQTTRRILKKLEELEVITKKTTPQGHIISFCCISNYIMTHAEPNSQPTAIHPPKPQVTVEVEETLETEETIGVCTQNPTPPPTPQTREAAAPDEKAKIKHLVDNPEPSIEEWEDRVDPGLWRSPDAKTREDAAIALMRLMRHPDKFEQVIGAPLLDPDPDFDPYPL